MNVRHTLICFLLLTLRDGNSGLTNAQNLDRTETEGGNFTVGCSFTFSGGRKLFCKGKCEEGNILVETTGDSEQRGRYSIRYKEGTLLSYAILSFLDSYQDIEIRVTDAPTSSKPEVTLRPFSTSASRLTTTQSLSSVPSSASPERTTQPPQGQTASDGHSVVLCVRLTLVVMMFIVLSASVLIFCRKRARKDPPVEPEYGVDTEANQVDEDVRGSGSPPVLISTIYSYAKYTKLSGVETTDEYSFVTAATSQKKTKDDPININYSEVDSSNSAQRDVNSESVVRTGTEGGDITVSCPFYLSGKRKIFCQGECGKGDTLLQTTADTARKGRYSIRFKEGTAFPYSNPVLYVGITKLTKSDAGRYKCGFGRVFSPSYMEFEIRVEDAPTSSKPEVTLRPFPTSASTLTTTQPPQGQTAPDGVVLYVRLTLVVMFLVLSASVLIFCRKRARKPRETADEAEYVNVTEAHRECEEVREEDSGSRSPPVEVSPLPTADTSQKTVNNSGTSFFFVRHI
ncbi:hypothetical protein KUCAC02_012153 [Chaenocephalus aceratus]|uniref:Uncharacterized protein n=1 Tax=Chaenocephalus aceratus TaxID=36190 RepID=A0ACB9XAX3_CHAAC|nr:hypothetical protein KUCAC02_012153 [Chaenocephalus aceratus]